MLATVRFTMIVAAAAIGQALYAVVSHVPKWGDVAPIHDMEALLGEEPRNKRRKRIQKLHRRTAVCGRRSRGPEGHPRGAKARLAEFRSHASQICSLFQTSGNANGIGKGGRDHLSANRYMRIVRGPKYLLSCY
jgi:hypothetical protein